MCREVHGVLNMNPEELWAYFRKRCNAPPLSLATRFPALLHLGSPSWPSSDAQSAETAAQNQGRQNARVV